MASGLKEAEETPGGDERASEGDAPRSRLGGGLSALFSRARERTGRIRDAALERRRSPAFQHACAARERGNLEAAFWLLSEEIERGSDAPEAALAFWEVALELGRPARAAEAAAGLVKRHAAAGDAELATLCWVELVRAVPEQLVPPASLAVLLPVLRRRVAEAKEEDRPDAIQLLRTALRHAMDSRNEAPSPGLALRIFEEARQDHPEAAHQAARLALESTSLHETKRRRLLSYLESGQVDEDPVVAPEPPRAPPRRARASPPERPARASAARPAAANPAVARPAAPSTPSGAASAASAPAEQRAPEATGRASVAVAAAAEVDLPASPEVRGVRPPIAQASPMDDPAAAATGSADSPGAPAGAPAAPEVAGNPAASDGTQTAPGGTAPASAAADGAGVDPAPGSPPAAGDRPALQALEVTPLAIGDSALEVQTRAGRRSLAFGDIQGISTVQVAGEGAGGEAVVLVDLILNLSQRGDKPLRVLRMRSDRMDLSSLGGELSSFLSELLARASAVPLPDPESAMGLRLVGFDSLAAYEQELTART